MNRIIRKSLLFVLSLCFVLSLGCFALFSPVKTQAEPDVDYDADAFEMEYGAQLKLTGDGMRFIVKMGSNKYEKIVGSDDITLSFLIAPKSYFDAVDEGANAGKYENLSKKIQIDIPDEKIYTHDGYYYANGVIQNLDENNNPALKNGSQYDYEFVATAMIKDATGVTETEYAAFNGGDMANNTRTQYNIIQAAVLKEDKDVASALMNSETSPYKSWFGTSTHPLRVDTVEKYEKYEALVAAGCDFGTCNVNPRTEEENKTLFLFDRELGAKQITSTDASAIAFDDGTYMQGGNGSLKITFNDKSNPVVAYNTLGYTGLDSGKYVVFYAYNDTDADYIDLGLNYTQRFRLHKGEWSMVIWAADGVAANTYIRFYGYNYDESDYKASTGVNITGNVYFTKAQVLDSSESEIAQMPTSAGENSYTVGNTALTAASWYQNGAYNPNSSAFNSETYGGIYYADGALRAHALAPNSAIAGNATLLLTINTPVAFAGNIMYITMKGAEEDYIYAQVFKDGGGHEGTPNGYVDKVYEDGFVRYAFPFFSTWSGNLKSFRLFALRNLKYPHMDEIIIRDITITSISSVAAEKRAGYDTDVIGLFDDPIGVTQISAQTSGISARYTREKHIEGETGSLKLSFSNAAEPAIIQVINKYGYTLESGKYVVFYMYNDTNAGYIDLALGYYSRVRVHKGEWTMICYESANVISNEFLLRLLGYSMDDSNYTGSVYLSRVKVLNSDKVQDATADADCTIGHTTFKGGISYVGNGDYYYSGSSVVGGFDTPFFRNPYMVDGVLRTILLPNDSGSNATSPLIRFELKDPVQCYDGTALYITMKGADTAASSVGAQIFCDGSHKGTPRATIVETLADGYYVYKIDLSVFKDEAPITYFRLFPIDELYRSRMAEIRISDITINSFSTLVDFFVDVPEGRDIVVLQITDTQIIDSDTMRRSDRLDATSISSYSNKTYDSMEKYCFKYLREMIDEVKPDFIIMTGDNTYGEFDDNGHILLRLIEVMESFEIPWAPVFGNHDLETNKGADWYSEQYENAEYCCFKQRTLSGNGNYTVGIRQGGELKRLFVMLDSEGCSNLSQTSLANGHTNTERGFKQDQIEWYTDTITKIKKFVPTVKISFAYHIQMEMAFKALRETYGSNLFPQYDYYVEIDPILSIDRVKEKQATDFGFVNEMAPSWDSDFTIYNGIKALGVDSMFLGHCHTNCYSVVYDGIRFQFGLKSSRHDFLAIVNKTTGAMRQWFWLDTDDGNTGSCPLIGGTVIPLSQDNGAILEPYIYYCTGAGKEVDWSQWNNTISKDDDWSSHYKLY